MSSIFAFPVYVDLSTHIDMNIVSLSLLVSLE